MPLRPVTTLALLLCTVALPVQAAAPAAVQPLDLSALSESARHELQQVMEEEFCGCGAPHTLAACIQTHTSCQHSRREVQLAANLAQRGAVASELGVVLARYNRSFLDARAKLPIDERMCMGDAKAPMTLVEFADFECPICGVSRPILEKFVQDRPGQVRLCYLPFPLTQHPNAMPAGQAALFARDHGKFWPVHDALFDNQKRLSPDVIKEIVVQAGLPADAWAKVLSTRAYVEDLDRYSTAGTAAGVTGTPTVYLNGRKLDFLPQAEMLQLTLEDEMDFQAHKGTWAAGETR
jgi:protein-disulfide isomerase